jgi:hypothetical protein
VPHSATDFSIPPHHLLTMPNTTFYEKRIIRYGCHAGLGVNRRHANHNLYATGTRTKGNPMRPEPVPLFKQ